MGLEKIAIESKVQENVKKKIIKYPGTTLNLLELRRSNLRLVTEFFTGHKSLIFHLKAMGISIPD